MPDLDLHKAPIAVAFAVCLSASYLLCSILVALPRQVYPVQVAELTGIQFIERLRAADGMTQWR